MPVRLVLLFLILRCSWLACGSLRAWCPAPSLRASSLASHTSICARRKQLQTEQPLCRCCLLCETIFPLAGSLMRAAMPASQYLTLSLLLVAVYSFLMYCCISLFLSLKGSSIPLFLNQRCAPSWSFLVSIKKFP